MKTKEQEIKQLMETLELTREEAEETWAFDHNENAVNEEADALTEKAKKNVKICEQSSVSRKSYERERKVDTEKKEIIEVLNNALFNSLNVVGEVKTETEINFTFNESDFTIKLTRHKKPKNT